MPWSYSQSTGDRSLDGDWVGTGYSGIGPGLNDPDQQDVPDVGPIPQGTYSIEAARDDETIGPISMPLTPYPANEMFGRDDFLIHGDTASMNHTASHGCIIMGPAIRGQIGASEDRTLIVTA